MKLRHLLVVILASACQSEPAPEAPALEDAGTMTPIEDPTAGAAGSAGTSAGAGNTGGNSGGNGALGGTAGSAVSGSGSAGEAPLPPRTFIWIDASDSHLPESTLSTETLDVELFDANGDGHLDVALACEYQRNRLLLGDGTGRFTDVTEQALPADERDSEDSVAADFNGDGLPDLVFVTEDGQQNDLYLNGGNAVFSAGPSFPVGGTSNAVVALDFEGDGDLDLIVGNRGQNFALVNDGQGNFTDETTTRLPSDNSITQDLALGDVDGDGDLDLIEGNEGRNRLLINLGSGIFQEAGATALPAGDPLDETREVLVGDVNGDGHLDLFFANAGRTGNLSRQNRLLMNDGNGVFVDETAERLPVDDEEALGGVLFDLDLDGDLDIVTATYVGRQGPPTPYRFFENDGTGSFTDVTSLRFPASATGHGFDVAAGDFNGDGLPDLYLGSARSRDRLLLSEEQ